ncbi:hypothetical protein T15_0688 [Streptococcus suis T15]|nr:hypothetical protein T15_0688 [Streptococcus suis T15]
MVTNFTKNFDHIGPPSIILAQKKRFSYENLYLLKFFITFT